MKLKKQSDLFRKESLEQLSSPEKLDQLMEVISRRDWLPLCTFGTLVVLAILWSIFGKIPLNIKSKGVLVYPNRIIEVQSPVSGQLQKVNVKQGDCVKQGDILAAIEPSDIRQKLQQEQDKLARLQSQTQLANNLQDKRTDLEIFSLSQREKDLRQSIQDTNSLSPVLNNQEMAAIQQEKESTAQKFKALQTIAPELRNKGLNSLKEQRISIGKKSQDFQELSLSFKKRLENRRELFKEGAISLEQILEAEQDYKKNLQNIFQLEADLKQLDVKETEIEQQYLDNLSSMSKYQAELRELTLKETQNKEKYLGSLSKSEQQKTELQSLATERKKIEQANLETSSQRKNDLQQVKYNIAQLAKQYNDNKAIKSPYSGCFLEITASQGSVLNQGVTIGAIQVNKSSQALTTVAYFPIGNGKKITPGMKIYITPDTVHREKFGSIIGTVSEVSPFPITEEAATKLIGNSAITNDLIAKVGPVIEVHAQLKLDPSTPSGYAWSSSQGPALKVTPGTTVTAQVTIEEQTPITLVLPILRQLTGVY